MNARPLTDAEYDRMSYVLGGFRDEQTMNLEELDGFFAAFICGPAPVDPSDYLPEIWGGEMRDEEAFSANRNSRFPGTPYASLERRCRYIAIR